MLRVERNMKGRQELILFLLSACCLAWQCCFVLFPLFLNMQKLKVLLITSCLFLGCFVGYLSEYNMYISWCKTKKGLSLNDVLPLNLKETTFPFLKWGVWELMSSQKSCERIGVFELRKLRDQYKTCKNVWRMRTYDLNFNCLFDPCIM